MVDAVKYPSLALSVFAGSSMTCEVVHCRDGRRHPSLFYYTLIAHCKEISIDKSRRCSCSRFILI